jgi:hypothetical protein
VSPARIAFPLGAALAVIGVGYFFFWPWRGTTSLPTTPAAAVAPSVPATPPGPQHPVAPGPAQELPTLNQSDASMLQALANLAGIDSIARVLKVEGLVRNIVATIDNLPSEEISQRVNPIQPAPGLLATHGKDGTLTLAAENSRRYAVYVALLDAVDTQRLVDTYRHFYPLYQQAYVELGYPNKYFNDRLVEVIDHLLATPEVKGPIRLVQPKVLYEFADPDLEALSAGQKAMLRMGAANAARVKAKLNAIRALVAKPA